MSQGRREIQAPIEENRIIQEIKAKLEEETEWNRD
ncbi:hypothetical protein QOZ98_002233 [Planomicrobium stackebrandtii]|uniref:Uncharacterized protein n=1 Tax=Planomicrobium stackebrandtii TaxID=253160 RepID=A0ABU0GVL8_9BACL|nr:hypothetical protein [Planomicrobium stackebrandtii]